MTPTVRSSNHFSPTALAIMALFGGVAASSTALAQSSVDKYQDFPLNEVQITDAYQQNLYQQEITYLLTTLDSTRLMAGFKAVSQNVTPTNLYGGWENSNIRGHSMGHWMSAVAHAYQQAQGGNPTLAAQVKTKLDGVVASLKSYQASNGFLFATPVSQFDDFDAGTGSTWVPYYTMHKILAGLIDIYELEGNSDALSVASNLGTWLYNRANGWSSAAKSRVLGQEYGGMNDALYELYKLTKNPNHLTVAHVFDDTSLFNTLAAGTDSLSGLHANMTIPKFIGALNRYRTVGSSESSYLNAATGFYNVVLNDHTYITGGNSEDEHFHTPKALNQYRDNLNDETCNAYNMTKLTRDLFMVTGDVKYADFYERVHINEILASMNPDTGMTTYFKPMGTGYFKAFGTTTNSFWCCTGTGMENFTRLDDSVYFHDAKNLWVTYYVSSTLNWSERGLSLTQTTDLPLSNKVTFTINGAPTDAVTLSFRKPDWTSSCQMAISVNGQAVSSTASGGFITVNRVWNAGDKVVIAFPLFLSVSRTPDNQNVVAFTYGPLVLSAGLGTASMTTTTHAATIAATSPGGLQDTIKVNSPTAVNDWLANINSNLVQTAGQLTFNLKGTDSDGKLVFIPHYSRYKDRYGIYWIMSGASGGSTSTTVTCPAVDAGGAGGASGTGGAAGGTGSGGAAGQSGSGGTTGSGGSSSSGGTVGSGGSSSGGTTGSGGSSSSGGTVGSGGSSSGGTTGSGGSSSTGGTTGTGGAIGSGGSLGSGGSSSGSGGSAPGDARASSGCSCTLAESTSGTTTAAWLSAFALLLGYRRRRRSSSLRA